MPTIKEYFLNAVAGRKLAYIYEEDGEKEVVGVYRIIDIMRRV